MHIIAAVAVTVAVGLGTALSAFVPAWSAHSGATKSNVGQLVPPTDVEQPALPVVDGETTNWITELQLAFGNDPNFGTAAISEDRETVTITWFGDPSPTLTAMIDRAPSSLVVEVRPSKFKYGELGELVRTAVRTPGLVSGIEVTIGTVENDASGIRLGIVELPWFISEEQVAAAFAQALGRTDVPITVEVSGGVVAISGSNG